MSQKFRLKGLLVQDIPLDQAVTVNKNQKLAEIIRVMQKQQIDKVLVVAEGRPLGVITVKDIAFKLGSKRMRRLSPSSIAASGFVSEGLVTADYDEPLLDASLRLESKGVSSLPIVGKEGSTQGLLTRSRIIDLLKQKYNVPVKEVAEPPTATTSSTAKLSQVLVRIRDKSTKSLIVLENLMPVGLISERELAFTLFNLLSSDTVKHVESAIDKMLVYDSMIRIRSKVQPETPLKDAVDLMQSERMLSLAVVEERKVVGLLTRDNIFSYFIGRERS